MAVIAQKNLENSRCRGTVGLLQISKTKNVNIFILKCSCNRWNVLDKDKGSLRLLETDSVNDNFSYSKMHKAAVKTVIFLSISLRSLLHNS